MSDSPECLSPGKSLQTRLHAATRAQHSALNQSITARLPPCLPPYTTTPTAYAKGMTVIGTVYLAFEEAWDRTLLQQGNGRCCRRHREILQKLQTPGLRRSEALQHDLDLIGRKLGKATSQELEAAQAYSNIFSKRIQTAISQKPHVTVAYAWTMYLALFNGGRWLLKQLVNPGPEFWQEGSKDTTDKIDALSFWYFDSSASPDGENLKSAFKANFESAASLLTEEEQVEVVVEGKVIFDLCTEMVEFLDQEQANQEDPVVKSRATMLYDWFRPAMCMWETLSSAASYVGSALPRPLREEVRPLD